MTAFLLVYRLWHQPSRLAEEGTVLGEEEEDEREGLCMVGEELTVSKYRNIFLGDF